MKKAKNLIILLIGFLGLISSNLNGQIINNDADGVIIDSVDIVDVLCGGDSTGAVTIYISDTNNIGGPYRYQKVAGPASASTPTEISVNSLTYTFTGLKAGNFIFAVESKNNKASIVFNISISDPSDINSNASISEPSCHGGSDGLINLSGITGGTGSYSNFIWSDASTNQNLVGASAGTYYVNFDDAEGCTYADTFTVGEPTPVTATATITDAQCYGASNGNIFLTASGGTPGYTFDWAHGPTTNPVFSLGAGDYDVTVRDGNLCEFTATYTVNQPDSLSLSSVITDATCYGSSDGTINVTTSGGTPFGGITYSFQWDTSGNVFAASEDISNVPSNSYTLSVTDQNGCNLTRTYLIDQPAQISSDEAVTEVSCNDGNDGSITLVPEGGTGPYTALWDASGNSGLTESGLSAGNYAVIITDSRMCTFNDTIEVTEPTAMATSISSTPLTCFGGADTDIDLTVTYGTDPYTYLWDDAGASTSQDLTNVPSGTYNVTITDNNLCVTNDSITINDPVAIVNTPTIDNILCNGDVTGRIQISTANATNPVSYVWNDGPTVRNRNNIAAGEYILTTTDGNGCSVIDTFTVTEPDAIAVSETIVDASCNGFTDGSISISISGGVPGYVNFVWNTTPLTNTQNLTNVGTGNYTISFDDTNGCTFTDTYTVIEPDTLVGSATITNVTCNGLSDGAIDYEIMGGSAPYNYSWNNVSSSTSQDITGEPAAEYIVTVTDSNTCVHRDTFDITEPIVISSSGVVTNVTCNTGNDGGVDLSVSGGTTPYTYAWNDLAFTINQDVGGLTSGQYIVAITDSNLCIHRDTFDITEPSPITSTAVITDVSCNNGNDGAIVLTDRKSVV